MLDEYGTHATFFTLGWIAERYPGLVRRIVANGHELASHGFAHQRATEQNPAAFFSDIQLAKIVLEDLAGVEVTGYRAPSFSIGQANPWAFECIERAGYQYSSSVYPIQHDHYGMPDAPRFAHDVRDGLLEVPVTTMRLFGRNWPAGGGGYFRLLALRDVALAAAPGQSRRPAAGDLLFPPLGDRSCAAAGSRDRCEDAISPLSQPGSNGAPPAQAAVRFRVGPRGRGDARSRLTRARRATAHRPGGRTAPTGIEDARPRFLPASRTCVGAYKLLCFPEWRPNPAAPLWNDRIQAACCAKTAACGMAGPVIREKDMKHHSSELGLASFAPSTVTVRALDAQDRAAAARWDAFVMGCRDATFFHRAGWQEIIESVFRHRTHFLYAEDAGRIVGVLPLAHVESWLFGDALVSLPFAVYGGVAADSPEAATALEDEAQALAQRLGVEHLELRNVAARHADWPTQDLYVTFRKEILPDVEANMLAIPRKQRAMVRKGIEERTWRARSTRTVDRFFALFADNVHRHGTPALPKRYFEALQRVFGGDCEVLTVTGQGRHAAVQRAELLLSRRGASLLCGRRRRGARCSAPTTSSTGS